MKKRLQNVIILAGGDSAEHEVSIITALQALEEIDTNKFIPIFVYQQRTGEFFILKNLRNRKEFLSSSRHLVSFGRDINGGFIQLNGYFGRKIYIDVALNCMHGGPGESGGLAGIFEMIKVPFSSTNVESSSIVMNKILTKNEVEKSGIKTVDSISLDSKKLQENSLQSSEQIIHKLNLPVIVKPPHLGSSIGIKVCKSAIELEKALIEASYIDSEILVEKFLQEVVEYNCAVFCYKDELICSEIEKPIRKDQILSFNDKYQNGSKKTGGGMSSLQRELPAKIDDTLREKIFENAKKAYLACRCKGMVRIDFMLDNQNNLYLTEINPVPGSLSFYLWEAAGIQFSELLDMLIEQAIIDFEKAENKTINYDSGDILKKFVD